MMEFPTKFAKCGVGNASLWYSIGIMFPIGGTISSTQDQNNLHGLNYGGNMVDSNHCLIIKY
jgi:hypothetical protein